jgi:GNAT superfamily N-acetyltransferase
VKPGDVGPPAAPGVAATPAVGSGEATGTRHEWHWVDRKRLPDAALAELLEDPRVEVHVLEADGEVAGFAELDRSEPGEVRLMYFGLAPGYIGRGLGRWFLAWVVGRAWSHAPARVWVDTCTLDHPRALPNYEAAGFRRYGTLKKRFEIPW